MEPATASGGRLPATAAVVPPLLPAAMHYEELATTAPCAASAPTTPGTPARRWHRSTTLLPRFHTAAILILFLVVAMAPAADAVQPRQPDGLDAATGAAGGIGRTLLQPSPQQQQQQRVETGTKTDAAAHAGVSPATTLLNNALIVMAAFALGALVVGGVAGYLLYKSGTAGVVLRASGVPGADKMVTSLPAGADAAAAPAGDGGESGSGKSSWLRNPLKRAAKSTA